MSGCIRQTTKKYVTRKSPPFPANECKNSVKIGNDGQMYRSTPDKNKVYRWKLIVEDEEEEEDENFKVYNLSHFTDKMLNVWEKVRMDKSKKGQFIDSYVKEDLHNVKNLTDLQESIRLGKEFYENEMDDEMYDQEGMMDCSEGVCRVKRKPGIVGAAGAAVGAAGAAVGAAGAAGAAMGAAVGAAKVAAGVPLAAAKAVGGVAVRAAKAVPVVVREVAEIPLGLGRVATGIAGKAVQGVTRAVERTVRAVSPLRGKKVVERVVLGETNLDVDELVSEYVNTVKPSLLERIRRAKIGLAKRGLI